MDTMSSSSLKANRGWTYSPAPEFSVSAAGYVAGFLSQRRVTVAGELLQLMSISVFHVTTLAATLLYCCILAYCVALNFLFRYTFLFSSLVKI